MIHIYSKPTNDGLRLKSYGATTRGDQSTLTIQISVTDHGHLGYLLGCLKTLSAAQKAADAAAKVKPPKRLALPAPSPRFDL